MTVYRRGDKWVAKTRHQGRYQWLGTFPTKREARAAEAAASPLRSSRITVDAFCETWLKDYARPSSSTRRNNRYALVGFRREFGSRRLSSIDRPEAQRWSRRVPYSQYRTVRTMYADALRDGFVQLNPFAQLRIPVPVGRKHIDVLTESEVVQLADCALEVYDEHFGPTMRAAILVAGFAGLRPAEIAELDWQDLDLRDGFVFVRHATGGAGERKAPKTESGYRKCALPPPACEALRTLERHEDNPAVFLTPRGRRFRKGHWHRYFVPVRTAFGRPKLTPYELRHACATLLLERGLSPEDVARQLGHKDGGNMVRTLYGHPNEDRQLDRIAMAFGEPSEVVASGSQPKADHA